MDLVIAGSYDLAFAHLAAAGLAVIVEDAGIRPVRWRWTNGADPRPALTVDVDEGAVAEIVQRHARRATRRESWVQATVDGGARAGVSLFSPRVKAARPEDVNAYESQRAENYPLVEGFTGVWDSRFIGALGKPAWWARDGREPRPDWGASRWEMKTRNKGEDFIGHRLRKLASVVAGRSTTAIADGLLGRFVADEAGKNASDSRSATGLATPGPVDNALAWCALWGLSMLPTVARRSAVSASTGAWPHHRARPVTAGLPVFAAPVSPGRFRSLASSHEFDVVANGDEHSRSAARERSCRAWLTEQGVAAIIRFDVYVTGSASAPERQLRAGTVDVL